MALLSVRDVSIGFGGSLVLEGINLQVERGERLGLLGRNGVGKSTLLKILAGELSPDDGIIVRERGVQGLRVAYLTQDVPAGLSGTVAEIVAAGLSTPPSDTTKGAQHTDDEAWRSRLLLDTVLARMQLDPTADFAQLSAGIKRRVLLARGLVCDPDLVLLDEPTNHLDTDAIAWLEDFLLRYRGTLIFVTHDRVFLRKLATRIIEIDRARLIDWACDYDTFAARKESILETEAVQEAVFDKKLAQEEVWIRQGIEARRTRNEGRVRALERLRSTRRERRERPGPLRMRVQEAERSGKLVIRARDAGFSYGASPADRPIVRHLTTTLMRGDKVGIVGPNGSGKTTLLRLLLGELPPQEGTVQLGANLEIAYFDQLRAQLEEDRTVLENVADGREFVSVNGRPRHVIGYLQDFLFSPERARAYASILSGGERNRLLLARIFARPSNVLVMDEPTNDLDLETLELLEDLLLDYEGALLLVSHDRELLNNVVTGTLALEGDGRVGEYVGGYDDWVRQRPDLRPAGPAEKAPTRVNPAPEAGARPDRPPRKLTFREQRELETLPARIDALEAEQTQLYRLMADPTIYQTGGEQVTQSAARLIAVEGELAEMYARWEELEGKGSQTQ